MSDNTDGFWENKTRQRVKTGPDDEFYDMNSEAGRFAIIFNHKEYKNHRKSMRNGTGIDKELLKSVLESKRFKVKDYDDLTKEKLIGHIEEVSQMDFPYDCILIVVLTHGGENGSLCAYDEDYSLDDIWKPLIGKFPDKPKLYLIQACRGTKPGRGIPVRTVTDGAVRRKTDYSIPEEADFYFMFSVVDGHYAVNDSREGAPFIQCFCKNLQEKSGTCTIEDIMRSVTNEMARREYFIWDENINKSVLCKALPHSSTTLRRKVLFSD